TSHNDDYKHLRPLTCAEEAAGLHKRVKRIHDPVKIVFFMRCIETESPIHQIEVCSSFLTSRPLTCAEEAAGLHKRVKRIHDPVKIVVSCD
ncbi:hypothetical protein HID58_043506, partial [Brassica napus]